MVSYWNVSVRVDGRQVVSTGDSTLAKTLERGIQAATYYQAIYSHAVITLTDVEENCARCYNTGKITTTRPRSTVSRICPECKGKLAHGRVEDITFKLSDDTSGIALVQTNVDTRGLDYGSAHLAWSQHGEPCGNEYR